MADGLPGHLAYPLATAEAELRARFAGVIGKKAALKAELVLTLNGDKLSCHLLHGSLSGLSGEQVDRLERLGGRVVMTVA
jgi:hypothetical protein